MHIISNKRALAHWRTLCRLPPDKSDLLEERFTQDQRSMVQAIAELTGAVQCSREASPHSPPDPRFTQFTQLLSGGALLAELFRREAGHPLAQLEAAELNSILRAEMHQTDAFMKSSVVGGPDIFTTSAQPDLLRGIAMGHLSVEGFSEKEGKALMIYRFLVQALHRACADAPPEAEGDWDVERILVALSVQGDPLRGAALKAAESFRAGLTPRFIEKLEWYAAAPEAALREDDAVGIHGLFLLAKWREGSAWPACRKLFSLSGNTSYELLGDLITEDGPILMAMLGGQRRDELQGMITDETLDEYCRGASLDALTCLVAWGEMSREEHVANLRELLTTRVGDTPENQHVFACAVAAACDLEAWELRPEIEGAYERNAVDESFIGLHSFLAAAAAKHGDQWQRFVEDHQPITDVAGSTRWLDDPSLPDDPAQSPFDESEPDTDGRLIADSAQPYIAPLKVGRNEPCPCGSGKKYKKCCGQ